MDTITARRAAYRARAHRHLACGVRTNGALPAGCVRCEVVDAYLARREQYRDAVEQQGRGDGHYAPVLPVVTFGWWLRQRPYPPTR